MVYEIGEGRITRKYNKTISYKKLELLRLAMALPYEIGGSLDFDQKGKFLRIQVYMPGDKQDEIILHDRLGIEFHTHPLPQHIGFPSVTDLMAQAKRSINSRTKVIRKYKKFRGPLALIFTRLGALSYAYKKCKLPTKKEQKEMLSHIMNTANSVPRDTVASINKTCRLIRPYGFKICFFTWQSIMKNGLKLTWESRRFHRIATK